MPWRKSPRPRQRLSPDKKRDRSRHQAPRLPADERVNIDRTKEALPGRNISGSERTGPNRRPEKYRSRVTGNCRGRSHDTARNRIGHDDSFLLPMA